MRLKPRISLAPARINCDVIAQLSGSWEPPNPRVSTASYSESFTTIYPPPITKDIVVGRLSFCRDWIVSCENLGVQVAIPSRIWFFDRNKELFCYFWIKVGVSFVSFLRKEKRKDFAYYAMKSSVYFSAKRREICCYSLQEINNA